MSQTPSATESMFSVKHPDFWAQKSMANNRTIKTRCEQQRVGTVSSFLFYRVARHLAMDVRVRAIVSTPLSCTWPAFAHNQQARYCPHPILPVGFLDGIMEKEGPQRLAGCSFHENGHQLLCGLELISVHANVLPLEPLTKLCEAHMARHAAADRQGTAAKIATPHNPAIIYKPGDGVVSSGLAYVAVRACQAVVC